MYRKQSNLASVSEFILQFANLVIAAQAPPKSAD